MNLQSLKTLSNTFPVTPPMPVLFIGHGNPMNAIETNNFSKTWQTLGNTLPIPHAILCISAHWETRGTHVTISENPKTIHDFGGFPESLYQVQYPAPGSRSLAITTQALLSPHQITLNHEWGFDHGCWSILNHLYPLANIPVIQLSLDRHLSPEEHIKLAPHLQELRTKGVLIIGSGNIVHNLRLMNFHHHETAYDWAIEANHIIKTWIYNRNLSALCSYNSQGIALNKSIPTPEHFLPLLYTLGATKPNEATAVFNDTITLGSIAMTGFVWSA